MGEDLGKVHAAQILQGDDKNKLVFHFMSCGGRVENDWPEVEQTSGPDNRQQQVVSLGPCV